MPGYADEVVEWSRLARSSVEKGQREAERGAWFDVKILQCNGRYCIRTSDPFGVNEVLYH